MENQNNNLQELESLSLKSVWNNRRLSVVVC